MQRQPAILALENGRVFRGFAFGKRGTRVGEVVFNTGLTGYQEVLTDPSYRGQIVAMTNPQIGNTGVNPHDQESERVWLGGFVVRELSPVTSSWRATGDLDGYLAERGIVGITGVDTRALTRELRRHGALGGVVTSDDVDPAKLVDRAAAEGRIVGCDLVSEVTCQTRYAWTDGDPQWLGPAPVGPTHRVVVYDFGVKRQILRMLVHSGVDLTVVPATTTAADALDLAPDGVFLSNGPGDPAALPGIAKEIAQLVGRVPIFGICLGHQLAAAALGGKTYKLKFGHHGGNHPIKNVASGKIEITTQNHGFSVDADSLPSAAEPTHWNLNDDTLEGFRLRTEPLIASQYHPEAAPGPHDSRYLFQDFIDLMAAAGRRSGATTA